MAEIDGENFLCVLVAIVIDLGLSLSDNNNHSSALSSATASEPRTPIDADTGFDGIDSEELINSVTTTASDTLQEHRQRQLVLNWGVCLVKTPRQSLPLNLTIIAAQPDNTDTGS